MSQTFARTSLQKIFRFLFKILTRLEIRDITNVPAVGGYILATNHLSAVDPALVYALVNRNDVTAFVAKKHHKNPFFRWIVDRIGGIWLNREEADSRAIRAAQTHLHGGGILGIAPEGTRSRERKLIRAKTGTAYLADKTGVPIVPVGIIGTERVFPTLLSFHRPRVAIRFGKPFVLPPVSRHYREADLKRNTDEIMTRIAFLLPLEYQGYYANHPRLLDLLSEENTSQSTS